MIKVIATVIVAAVLAQSAFAAVPPPRPKRNDGPTQPPVERPKRNDGPEGIRSPHQFFGR